MTTDFTTEHSLDDLVKILSALDGQKRNPSSKKAAINAIGKKATEMGIDVQNVFDTADCLLSGAVTAEHWREVLIDDVPPLSVPAEVEEEAITWVNTMIAEAAAEEEPAEADEPGTEGPLAEDEVPIDLHSDEYVETEFAKKNDASWAKVGKKDRKPRVSKQASVIAMLKRPEGATIEQIAGEFGWQRHTVRGMIAGALKKKLGLNVTSGKIDGRRTSTGSKTDP